MRHHVTTSDHVRTAPAAGAVRVPDRPVRAAKPVLRGWSHFVCFEASLVIGTLVVSAAAGALRITAAAIYAASVSAMFGTSALYHLGQWKPAVHRALQSADHATISLLIAGTATPIYLLAAPRVFGVVCLIVLWSLTVGSIGLHVAWPTRHERLRVGIYLAMGWTACLALPALWTHGGVASALLVAAGGLLYTVGALVYHRRRPDPRPEVFGYHEVFHTYVCLAAACQYVALAVFVL
ncbi:PAQR family membrane homeostasis protein TrhA [Paractinoplanes hotanensis]|uniref:Hemolysin III family protein n=1 Tax=Paractinoplanes hotanensis TaxID=2906497 RepID=A0ABT0YFR0_9ACTN|nr:hemolysin III family protein [Actinoplanes hotanensis]MCM4084348.1 hemolysin III family protein [Actinoplanes hotanensis]